MTITLHTNLTLPYFETEEISLPFSHVPEIFVGETETTEMSWNVDKRPKKGGEIQHENEMKGSKISKSHDKCMK